MSSNMLVESFEAEKDSIRAQIGKAIAAIQKYAEKKDEERAQSTGTLDLLADPETVTVSFSLDRIPVKKDFRFHEIVVPHAIIDAEKQSLCLLVRDPKQRAVAAVEAHKLPIEKVIAVKSLKRKYASHDSRRELANRFDLFLCERPTFEMMGKLLGSYFFETKKAKIPMPIRAITKTDFDLLLRTARFRVRGGSVVGVRVGRRDMSTDQLVDNAMAVIQHMATKYCTVETARNNVFNISVGATNVIELPVWSVPVSVTAEDAVVVSPAATPTKPKAAAAVKAEVPAPVEAPKDLSAVPLKQLKAVQQQKVESAKKQLVDTDATSAAKKKRKVK